MSPMLHRILALWAALLSAAVCLEFLPLSRMVSVLMLLAIWGVIVAIWYVTRPRPQAEETLCLDNLPDAAWRQPVVLVCGDLSAEWPADKPVLTVSRGCWIRVEHESQLEQVVHQLLWLRPQWGRQLAIMVTVCPQRHTDVEALNAWLLALRWQIHRLRKTSRHNIPLIFNGLVGSRIAKDVFWQSAMPGENVCVWRESHAPSSIASWITTGGAMALEQQVVMNSLMAWFRQYVKTAFIGENAELPPVMPSVLLWGLSPRFADDKPSSLWIKWLSQHTSLTQVAGWLPVKSAQAQAPLLPEFVLPLLPNGSGLTPGQRAARHALGLFTIAAAAALVCSAWSNQLLIKQVGFDIAHYYRISMEDYDPKASAVQVLRQDAARLDEWARNGEPLYMGLGLYEGSHLHLPVLKAIRSWIPPEPPAPEPEVAPAPPSIIRLDSMALFDSGKATLKAGSTRLLVNSLVGIKARPGWLIVVSGHTDNTGNPQRNQLLSLQRAEAVRDWMRDTGDVPQSCFAVQGYGADRPVATNDTTEGRALNRRVEISLVPQADACQVPGVPDASSQDDDDSHLKGE